MKHLKSILTIVAGVLGSVLLVSAVFIFCLPGFIILIESVFPHAPSVPTPEETIGSYQRITDVAYYFPFQDGMRYSEYRYSQASFEANTYFKKMTPESMARVGTFTENFSWWVNTFEDSTQEDELQFYKAYSYDCGSLSEDDFYYVSTDSESYPLSAYKVYIFDTDRMTLYYMEMN